MRGRAKSLVVSFSFGKESGLVSSEVVRWKGVNTAGPGQPTAWVGRLLVREQYTCTRA